MKKRGGSILGVLGLSLPLFALHTAYIYIGPDLDYYERRGEMGRRGSASAFLSQKSIKFKIKKLYHTTYVFTYSNKAISRSHI